MEVIANDISDPFCKNLNRIDYGYSYHAIGTSSHMLRYVYIEKNEKQNTPLCLLYSSVSLYNMLCVHNNIKIKNISPGIGGQVWKANILNRSS